jgi:hypothetical protein
MSSSGLQAGFAFAIAVPILVLVVADLDYSYRSPSDLSGWLCHLYLNEAQQAQGW